MRSIQVLADGSYFLKANGSEMTLSRANEGWSMSVVNAAVRAWNRGYATPKKFESLEAVEEKYKSWRGIAALAQTAVEAGI